VTEYCNPVNQVPFAVTSKIVSLSKSISMEQLFLTMILINSFN